MSDQFDSRILDEVSRILERVSRDTQSLEESLMELCEAFLDEEEASYWDGHRAGYRAGYRAARDSQDSSYMRSIGLGND